MAITSVKFTPRAVPNEVAPSVRAYLDDQLRRLGELVNTATLREDDETIEGDWTFLGTVKIADAANSDFGEFSHDGTSFNFAFTNTFALNITGAGVHKQRGNFAFLDRWASNDHSDTLQSSFRSESGTGDAWSLVPEPGGTIAVTKKFGFHFTADEWFVDEDANLNVKAMLKVGAASELADDGTLMRLSQGIRANYVSATMGLADDATASITLPNGAIAAWVMLSTNTTGAGENSYALLWMFGTTFTSVIDSNAVTVSVGTGSNPDVDGDINIWAGSSGVISVKNRRGSFRYVTLHCFTN